MAIQYDGFPDACDHLWRVMTSIFEDIFAGIHGVPRGFRRESEICSEVCTDMLLYCARHISRVNIPR